jgi:hypothetical protein
VHAVDRAVSKAAGQLGALTCLVNDGVDDAVVAASVSDPLRRSVNMLLHRLSGGLGPEFLCVLQSDRGGLSSQTGRDCSASP